MVKPQSATTTLKSLSFHLRRLQARWPADPVRPASVSIPTYLSNQNQTPTPSEPGSTTSTSTSPSKSSPPTPSSINALYSLLEDRYAKAYPIPQHLRFPASNLSHYDDLVREFAEAPTRSWFGSLRKKLGGLLRMR